ncbi:unnamed protein product [Ectocarpus sp. CCAP 1310/34]|nr:unnamed protein product [Ectocarpus sp. CCAP 1310/34]
MAADALLGTCLGALDLLLELSENCPDLMSPYANTVGDLVLGGGGRTLHPRLLDKAARCLAVLTRQSNGIGMVNELMNHVQKQVFFLGAGSGGGGGRLGGATGFPGGRQGAGVQAGHGSGLGRSGDPDAERKSAIVLAMHLMRGGALEERDEDALLGWAVRLLSLLRGGPSSLHTIALTLELLVTATSGDLCSPGGQGGRSGNDSAGGATSDGRTGIDHRREGWRRAGAAAAGRCLAGIGVLRLEGGGRGAGGDGGGGGGREGFPQWQGQEGEVEEEEARLFGEEQGRGGGGHVVGQMRGGRGLAQTTTPSSPASGATLCVRDMAIAMWREGNTTLSESARSLHSSWFAAITLSCRNETSSAAASSAGGGDTAFHSNGTPASSAQHRAGDRRAATGGTTDRVNGGGSSSGDDADARGGGSWLRARLSMPVWPFSDESYGDKGPVEDSGGYWGVGGGTDGWGGGYSLWRIPTVECAWQGKEGTQQLVEAGAACVAARSLLSSAAKYLLAHLAPTGGSPLLPERFAKATNNNIRSGGGGGNDYGSRGARRCHADADSSDTGGVVDLDAGETSGPGSSSLLSDLVWRYLELGARGRVCVAALRRTARQVAGSGGGSGGGKGGDSAGVRGSAASTEGEEEEEERAATRLEEGLSLAAMATSPTTASSSQGEEATSTTSDGRYVKKKDGGCRSAENRAMATSTTTMGNLMNGVKTPSIVLMAYVELLRTLVTRLESGGARGGGAAVEAGGGGAGGGAEGPAGVAPGVRALDVETLFRKTLPILRKAQAASKTALLAKLTPQKRRRESLAALQNKKTPASANRLAGRTSGGGGRAAAAASAETTKRRTRSIHASRGGGSRDTARWLGGDSVRRRGGRAVSSGLRGVMEGGDSESEDGQEEEEDDEVFFSDEDSRDSEWSSSETDDSSEDEDSSSDESDQEAEDEPRYPRTSTPKGKRRAAAAAAATTVKKTGTGGPWSETPAGARRAGGASSSFAAGGGRTADGEANPWEGLPGLSLCQFWRYRLLLEVVLAARGGVGGGEERSDGGGWAELPRTEFVEVMKQLASATSSRPASTAAIDTSGGGGDDLYDAEEAVFSELSEQHDRAEDGLLAGMVVEVLAALSAGLPRSEEGAVLSWKGLRAVYPRGYGAGYSHIGGVVGGLRSRLRGQLQFPPHMGNASAMLSRTGLPALPFLQHAFLTHWALSGRMGRAWGVAAAVVDVEAFVLGKTGPTCKGSEEPASRQQSSSARHKATPSSSSWSSSPPTPTPTPVLSQENFDVFMATLVKLLPASLALAAPQTPPAGPPASSVQGGATGSCVTGRGVICAEGGSRARGSIPGVSSSPYEELECLGMVLECLVEACIESLYNGAWCVKG